MKQHVIYLLGVDIQRAYNKKELSIKNRRNFTLTETTYTITLFFPDDNVKYIYSSSIGSYRLFSVMSKIKKEVTANISSFIGKDIYDSEKIRYYEFADSVYKCSKNYGEVYEFEDVIELDISAAYTYSLFNCNLIDKELLDEVLALPKKERLKAVGSIATRKKIQIYKDGVLTDEKNNAMDEIVRKRRNAWFYLCKVVDDVMFKCYKSYKDKCLFYFVDGIYFLNAEGITEKFKNIFTENGFEYKHTLIKQFSVVNRKGDLYVRIVKPDDKTPDDAKIFSVPKKQIIKYYINDQQ